MTGAANGIMPVLGTMTFGEQGQVKPNEVAILLRSFVGAGCAKTPKGALLDTAGFYPNDTEDALGQIFEMTPSLKRMLSISTKASKDVKPHFSLSRQSVIDQCETSLEKLGVDCIHLFYLQAADTATDMNETLDGISHLHQEGKIVEFGLSNYPASAVADICNRCKARGMILPTAYQGKYNVLSRDLEKEVVPVLREFGLRLYAYNPLAGGLLSGRYINLDHVLDATEGRFSQEFDTAYGGDLRLGTVQYRNRYAKPLILNALDVVRKACLPPGMLMLKDSKVVHDETTTTVVTSCAAADDTPVRRLNIRVVVSETAAPGSQGLNMANVSLRWLLHHSCLTKGDGIILGVSENAHLVANLAAWQGEKLDWPIIAACEKAWETAKPACEPYCHGYGAQPEVSESLLEMKRPYSTDNVIVVGDAERKKAKVQ